MQERRLCPRRRVLKSGLIVRRSGNGPTIECAVRNISDLGACLQISVAYDLSMDLTLVRALSEKNESGGISLRARIRFKNRTGR